MTRPALVIGANTILAKDQPEYEPLPACVTHSPGEPSVIKVAFELSPEEVARLLFGGFLIVEVLGQWPPMRVSVEPKSSARKLPQDYHNRGEP